MAIGDHGIQLTDQIAGTPEGLAAGGVCDFAEDALDGVCVLLHLRVEMA